MALSNNINRVGRIVRFISGLVLFATGVFMMAMGVPGMEWGWRIFQSVFIAAGLFVMFEGAIGWCALRAMGFKTPI